MFHHMGEMATESGTQAIDRAAELLVARRRVAAVRSGSGSWPASSGLPKSTTSRLVGALERRGLVQRAGDRRVARGRSCCGSRTSDRSVSLVELALPALRTLAELSGETINLGVPTPLGVEHLAQEDSRHFIGGTNWVGRRVPYDSTANGKVLQGVHARAAPPTARAIRARGYALGRRRARARALPRSPLPSSAPTAMSSLRSRSPGRPSASPASASLELAPHLIDAGALGL